MADRGYLHQSCLYSSLCMRAAHHRQRACVDAAVACARPLVAFSGRGGLKHVRLPTQDCSGSSWGQLRSSCWHTAAQAAFATSPSHLPLAVRPTAPSSAAVPSCRLCLQRCQHLVCQEPAPAPAPLAGGPLPRRHLPAARRGQPAALAALPAGGCAIREAAAGACGRRASLAGPARRDSLAGPARRDSLAGPARRACLAGPAPAQPPRSGTAHPLHGDAAPSGVPAAALPVHAARWGTDAAASELPALSRGLHVWMSRNPQRCFARLVCMPCSMLPSLEQKPVMAQLRAMGCCQVPCLTCHTPLASINPINRLRSCQSIAVSALCPLQPCSQLG